ncbi:MAG: hypothetical protein AB4352_27910 [Hormoscilla sp.]
MSDWWKLFPPYLLVLTVLLVILPTIAAICLRISLYSHLIFLESRVLRLINDSSRGMQPQIVENLEQRFRQASSNLEQVNTFALISGLYSKEKFKFLGFSWRCVQWDEFCRYLPNLLVALGLLGTFLGITLNLFNLSMTITQLQRNNVTDVAVLFQKLQSPLQGMGIAFITSLLAVACSALLTVVNLRWNTNLAKSQLILSLEDYLDNVLQPTIEGHGRLDKAVNRMVEQQHEFLTRFHDNVTAAMERSLGKVAEQIAAGNREATELATRVYDRFSRAAGTIANAADEFNHAVAAMQATTEEFAGVAQIFEQSQFARKLSTATMGLVKTQAKFDRSTVSLAETVKSMERTGKILGSASQQLVKLLGEISSANQTTVQVLELHQQNQQSLHNIIPELQQTVERFQSGVTILNKMQSQIVNKADSMEGVKVELLNLVTTMNRYTDQINLAIQYLGQRLTNNVPAGTSNQQLQAVTAQVNQGIHYLGDRILAMGKETNSSNQQLLKQLEACVRHLVEAKQEIYWLRETLEQPVKFKDDANFINKLRSQLDRK